MDNGSHPEKRISARLGWEILWEQLKFGSPTLGTKERKWETHGTLFRVSADGVITTICSRLMLPKNAETSLPKWAVTQTASCETPTEIFTGQLL